MSRYAGTELDPAQSLGKHIGLAVQQGPGMAQFRERLCGRKSATLEGAASLVAREYQSRDRQAVVERRHARGLQLEIADLHAGEPMDTTLVDVGVVAPQGAPGPALDPGRVRHRPDVPGALLQRSKSSVTKSAPEATRAAANVLLPDPFAPENTTQRPSKATAEAWRMPSQRRGRRAISSSAVRQRWRANARFWVRSSARASTTPSARMALPSCSMTSTAGNETIRNGDPARAVGRIDDPGERRIVAAHPQRMISGW